MNILGDRLRNDTFGGILNLGTKSWWAPTAANAISTLLQILIIVPIVLAIFGFSIEELLSLKDMAQDPVAMQRRMESLVNDLKDSFSVSWILMGVLAFLVMMVISSWVQYVGLLSVDHSMTNDRQDVGGVLSKSLNKNVINIFLVSLILLLLFTGLIIGVSVLTGLARSAGVGLGVLLGLASMLFVGAFMMRTIIALPLLIFENYSVMGAIKESLRTISLKKGLKYLLFGMLVMMGLSAISLAISLIGSLLAVIPFLGAVISVVLNVMYGGFVMALTSAMMYGIYYKYIGYKTRGDDSSNLEEHLVYEN